MNSRLEGAHQLQRRSSPMANERKQSSPKMEITKLNHELIEECKRSQEDSILSRHLRHELEKYVQIQILITGTLPKIERVDNRFVAGQLPHNQYIVSDVINRNYSDPNRISYLPLYRHPRESRREVVRKQRNGCAPLFIACKRGAVVIAEYLITICEADIEQRGHFEVPEDNSFHYVSPLWAAVVSGKLSMVKYLVRIGCDINATSDSGSTPVRSACYMTHTDIGKML